MDASQPPGSSEPPQGPEPSSLQGPQPALLDLVSWTFSRPTTAMRSITSRSPLSWALAVLIGVALLTGLAGALQVLALPSQLDTTETIDDPRVRAFMAIGALPGTAIIAGLFHLVAALMRGNGSYRGMFSALCYSQLPQVIQVPLAILPVLLPVAGGAVNSTAGFAIFIWTVVLAVLGIRENYGLTTGRAIAVLPISAVLLLAVVAAMVILIVLLVLALVGAV